MSVFLLSNFFITYYIAGTRLLLCFSLITNSKKLYAVSRSEAHGEFQAIQGFRAMTACVFVLAHLFLVVLSGPIRNPEWVEKVSY
jgi:hypothetical protein